MPNVALSSMGAVATASSILTQFGYTESNFPPSSTIDGSRTGAPWTAGGGWHDNTNNVYPDWVQIDFAQSYTINQIIVYSIQDNFNAPIEPTDEMTFSLYGLIDFSVQGWNGTNWVVLGSVIGNNLVKKSFEFPPYTTNRIKVEITSAGNSWSRIAEIEAFAPVPIETVQGFRLLPFTLLNRSDPVITPTNSFQIISAYNVPYYQQHSGNYKISGVTIANGIPFSAHVLLYPQKDPSLCIRSMHTDSITGVFEFTELAAGNYMVTAIDTTDQFRRLTLSMIAAVPM